MFCRQEASVHSALMAGGAKFQKLWAGINGSDITIGDKGPAPKKRVKTLTPHRVRAGSVFLVKITNLKKSGCIERHPEFVCLYGDGKMFFQQADKASPEKTVVLNPSSTVEVIPIPIALPLAGTVCLPLNGDGRVRVCVPDLVDPTLLYESDKDFVVQKNKEIRAKHPEVNLYNQLCSNLCTSGNCYNYGANRKNPNCFPNCPLPLTTDARYEVSVFVESLGSYVAKALGA